MLGAAPSSLRAYFVWLPMMGEADTRTAAELEAALYPDRRVTHFWDGDGAFAVELARTLKLNAEKAWDIYLLYDARGTLRAPPAFWMHQLENEAAPRLDAARLREELAALAQGHKPAR